MKNKIKILAVDDNDMNLRLLTIFLEEAGYEAVLAYDGDEVFTRLEAHPDISVILLDRMMPHMNGLDALKHLKRLDLYKHIPVIMITASWSAEQEAGIIQAGAYAYMAKPYNKEKIISTVKTALQARDAENIPRTDELKVIRKELIFIRSLLAVMAVALCGFIYNYFKNR